MAQVQRRIPSEEEITIAFRRLDDSPWATILARMLVYGVRPHEAHLGTVTDDGLFLVPSNTKTGERIVPPFEKRPGWIRRARGPLPKVTAKTNRDYGVRTYQAFKRRDVPFLPTQLAIGMSCSRKKQESHLPSLLYGLGIQHVLGMRFI